MAVLMAMKVVNKDTSVMPCLEIDKAQKTNRLQGRPPGAGTNFVMHQVSRFENWENSQTVAPGQASM